MLYREAVIWKRLKHVNVVPFIGVTFDPPQVVSEWISGEDLTTHVKFNPRTSRITLVSPHFRLLGPETRPQLHNSWSVSRRGLITFTSATWFTEISKG